MRTAIGPLEFLVVAFPAGGVSDRVAQALRKVEVSGDVRIVDAVVVVKDRDGRVRGEELVDVEELAPIAAEYGLGETRISLVDAEDVEEVGEVLAPGSVGLAILVEHAWARETADAVRGCGGALMAAIRIPDGHATEALESALRAVTGSTTTAQAPVARPDPVPYPATAA